MAKNKGIFDADILIHLCKTSFLKPCLQYFDEIYISDYVLNTEIKKSTPERKLIDKQINKQKIKVLEYNNLTTNQREIYNHSYIILKNQTFVESINEGERITAAFANAYKVYYYMSDDNKAAPYISSLAGLEVINYCDLLYISLIMDKTKVEDLNAYYNKLLLLYDKDKIPRIFKDKSDIMGFARVMANCKMKFDRNPRLKDYVDLLADQRKDSLK